MTQRVAVAPEQPPVLLNAVREAGAEIVDPDAADVLVFFGQGPDALRDALEQGPGVRWVQLPLAGIEQVVDILDTDRVWTCAKGVYGRVVAEHGVALMASAARGIHRYARERRWTGQYGWTLEGTTALMLGGGGIVEELLAMLAPLGVRSTVVRRRPQPLPGAERTIGTGELADAIPEADWIVIAWALTPETEGYVDAGFMNLMRPDAWVVNLGRGKHVRTDDLVEALCSQSIGGAALDVTDPEPLPEGHPLWTLDNVIITPHVANTWELGLPLLARRVTENLRRDRSGEPLLGLVDVELGY